VESSSHNIRHTVHRAVIHAPVLVEVELPESHATEVAELEVDEAIVSKDLWGLP
jgi:hypothetical protein